MCVCVIYVYACSSSSRSQRGLLAYIYMFLCDDENSTQDFFFPESSTHCWKEIVLEMLRISVFTIKVVTGDVGFSYNIYIYFFIQICI